MGRGYTATGESLGFYAKCYKMIDPKDIIGGVIFYEPNERSILKRVGA